MLQENQLESEATFFSRSSKSLRSAFDLSSSRMWFRRLLCSFRVNLINWISSVFLPTCSNVASNLDFMLGMSSRIGLNSLCIASMSVPTSVTLNLSSFLTRFVMAHIVMERRFFVKQKICRRKGSDTRRFRHIGDTTLKYNRVGI